MATNLSVTRPRAAEFIRIRNAVEKQKNVTKGCYERTAKKLRIFFDEHRNVLSFRNLAPIFLPILPLIWSMWDEPGCACIVIGIFYSALLFLCFACDTAVGNAEVRLKCFEKRILNNELFMLE